MMVHIDAYEHFAHRNFNPFQSTYKNIFSNFVSSENPQIWVSKKQACENR